MALKRINKVNYDKKVEFAMDNKVNLEEDGDKPKFKYVNTTKGDVFATLEVKSTSNPDVYKLNAVERVMVDGKKILKRVPMGIAYISGIDKSHKISKIFSQEKKVLMKCKFINDKSKWEPIEVDKTSAHPSLLENIDLELMELSEEEN